MLNNLVVHNDDKHNIQKEVMQLHITIPAQSMMQINTLTLKGFIFMYHTILFL